MLQKLQLNMRIALVAIVLFLVFDFTALALNFWLSWKIEEQAISINLAGRQRMLSQRMVKALLQTEDERIQHGDPQPHLDELQLTVDLFDSTLRGFASGAKTRGGEGEAIFLNAVSQPEARAIVHEAEKIWNPYHTLVTAVLKGNAAKLDVTLEPALLYAKQHNLQLLSLMNKLTTELEQQTQLEAGKIRWFQGAAFALALLNFIGAFGLYLHRMQLMSRNHSLLDGIIDKVSTCVLVVNHKQEVIKANRTAEMLFGCRSGDLIGRHVDDLIKLDHGQWMGRKFDQTYFHATLERDHIMMDDTNVSIITLTDITQQRKTEEHLSALAHHDILTQLPNRLMFDDRLALEIAHAQRNGTMLAVLFLDIDEFKPVNDQYGHEMGDKLLQAIAARLRALLREADTVSRRGGDEFTVIIPHLASPDAGEKVAVLLIEQLGTPYTIDGLELRVGVSIGISLYPRDGLQAQQLVNQADEAMYRAKQAGRNSYRNYS